MQDDFFNFILVCLMLDMSNTNSGSCLTISDKENENETACERVKRDLFSPLNVGGSVSIVVYVGQSWYVCSEWISDQLPPDCCLF